MPEFLRVVAAEKTVRPETVARDAERLNELYGSATVKMPTQRLALCLGTSIMRAELAQAALKAALS